MEKKSCKAGNALLQVLHQRPGCLRVYYSLGNAYKAEGQFLQAEIAFIAASRLAPKHKGVQKALQELCTLFKGDRYSKVGYVTIGWNGPTQLNEVLS